MYGFKNPISAFNKKNDRNIIQGMSPGQVITEDLYADIFRRSWGGTLGYGVEPAERIFEDDVVTDKLNIDSGYFIVADYYGRCAVFGKRNGQPTFVGMSDYSVLMNDYYEPDYTKMKTGEALRIMRYNYLKGNPSQDTMGRHADPIYRRIAESEEALIYFERYWEYVRWNEHGNEAALGFEVTYENLVEDIIDPEYARGYLVPEDLEDAERGARDLCEELNRLHKKYAP